MASVALPQEPEKGKAKGKDETPFFVPKSVPAHAVEIALADASKLPEDDRPFIRYLWVASGVREDVQAVAAAMNYISRASVPHRPVPVDDKGYLLRVDLRAYFPREQDIIDALSTWEELRFDPKFSLLITRDTLDLLKAAADELPDALKGRKVRVKVRKEQKVKVKVAPYTWTDGKVYDWNYKSQWVNVTEERALTITGKDLEGTEVIRLNPLSIDPKAFDDLQQLLGTEAPVISHTYFIRRALSSIRGKGLFRDIYGGLYANFRGLKKSDKKGVSDLDLLLESLGVGGRGKNFKQVFDELRSDRRVAIFRSGVTGKPRRVLILPTLNGDGTSGVCMITQDLKDGSIDIGKHPILNLVDSDTDAMEVIYTLANGFLGYDLFNGEGVRQEVVPPDVAQDRTIPAPHTMNLEYPISCMRCHGSDGSDGWKPLPSDAKTLLRGRLDVIGDVKNRNALVTDTIDRLARQYAGSPNKTLLRARDDFAEAHLRATGPWKDGGDQAKVVKLSSDQIAKIWNAHWYELCTARTVLEELGFGVNEERSRGFLKALLPPDPNARFGDVYFEDPRIGAPQEGIGIGRVDLDLTYSFQAFRALRSLKDLENRVKEGQKK